MKVKIKLVPGTVVRKEFEKFLVIDVGKLDYKLVSLKTGKVLYEDHSLMGIAKKIEKENFVYIGDINKDLILVSKRR